LIDLVGLIQILNLTGQNLDLALVIAVLLLLFLELALLLLNILLFIRDLFFKRDQLLLLLSEQCLQAVFLAVKLIKLVLKVLHALVDVVVAFSETTRFILLLVVVLLLTLELLLKGLHFDFLLLDAVLEVLVVEVLLLDVLLALN
jgi:hypothetical protein